MADPIGSLAQSGANTDFLAIGQEIFDRPPEGPFTAFTEVLPCDGLSLEIDGLGPSMAVEELLGSRVFENVRAYAKRIEVKPYSVAMTLPRLRVEKDKTGQVQKRLRDFLNANASFWDKVATDVFLTNPTGIDGTALLSNSHPWGASGGTWDNLGGGAISSSELRAAWEAMTSLTNEKGEPMYLRPTHLMVGPAYEQEALDLVGAMRAIPYNSSGAPDATSSVVAAVTLENWLKGRLQVIVNPRFVGSAYDESWLLMDLSKPGVKPIVMGEAIRPQPFVVDASQPGADPMLNRSEYAYYVEGAAAVGGFIPHCCFGYIG